MRNSKEGVSVKDKEYNLKFSKDTLFDSYSKLARVNLLTGEFEFVKMDPGFHDVDYEDLPDIFSYIKKQVDEGIVISGHDADYIKYSDPDYARRRVFSGDLRTVHSYKRRYKDGYKWVTFGIVAPDDCSPENPYALFCWREADTDTTTMVDALTTLSSLYYKILKVNLTNDSFEVIKTVENLSEIPTTISGWFKKFRDEGNVFSEDIENYREFTDLNSLRERFKTERSMYSCRYRRLQDGIFKWVQLDLVPSIEYSDDNQVMILYVKDVHEQHLSELRTRAELAEMYKRDALTLLYNRHKYNDDISELENNGFNHLVCLYIDVNGLHEMNNHLGHQSGDNMLCSVADALRNAFAADERVYRIGGDEFVVICKSMSKESAERLIQEARNELLKDNYEIAVGIAEGTSQEPVRKILEAAEMLQREDKENYYRNKGDRRRKRQMNEKLEKLLIEKKDEEYLLKLLKKHFAGVYFVDMNQDTVRHIYMPDFFSDILKESDFCYSKALKNYAEVCVVPEYIPFFEQVTDYTWLRKVLKTDGSLNFEYCKTDGQKMHLHILSQNEDNENKGVTVWIFAPDALFLGEDEK